MKFMVSWRIAPGHHKPAAEGFLATGAPTPEGVKLAGRWHAPGSGRGWALLESDDLTAVAAHVGRWASLLEVDVTPVLEDNEAGQALAKVYGK